MKATITNTSRANQGVWTEDGLVHLAAGETKELVIKADYVERAKSLPFLKFADATDLKDMKVADLKALAEAEGIDLGDAKKQADIVAAIELAREEKAQTDQTEA